MREGQEEEQPAPQTLETEVEVVPPEDSSTEEPTEAEPEPESAPQPTTDDVKTLEPSRTARFRVGNMVWGMIHSGFSEIPLLISGNIKSVHVPYSEEEPISYGVVPFGVVELPPGFDGNAIEFLVAFEGELHKFHPSVYMRARKHWMNFIRFSRIADVHLSRAVEVAS